MPDPLGLARGSLSASIQFLVAIFILYYVFRDRGEFLHGLRDLLPLSDAECDRVFTSAADSVHANVHAILITSLIDASSGTVVLYLLGVGVAWLFGRKRAAHAQGTGSEITPA